MVGSAGSGPLKVLRFLRAIEFANAARFSVGLVAFLVAISADRSYASEPRIAVFDFELLDTSLEGEMLGENEAERQRLQVISDELRGLLQDSNRYQVVDPSPCLLYTSPSPRDS